jgi:choline dehydrogenase
MNQRRGVRWSATKAFLRPVLGRPNLTVRTGALVERVSIEARDGGPRATGVVARFAGAGAQLLKARREVLLAAGAIGSPQILQLSGVGPGRCCASTVSKSRRSPAWGEPADHSGAVHL